MNRKLSNQQLQEYLNELAIWHAIEFQYKSHGITKDCKEHTHEKDVILPYVMNDAVECYLLLTEGNIQGALLEKSEDDQIVSFIEDPPRKGILISQEGHTASIWYSEAYFVCNPYQYHRIGHKWRSEGGEEHWRRIVNILCVIHDKVSFLKDDACNENELFLADLIEFAPLCYWSPINDSIIEWYPETDRGVNAMLTICNEINDHEMIHLISAYRASAVGSRKRKLQMKRIIRAFLKSDRNKLFWHLEEKIRNASLQWPEREYSEDINSHINELRDNISESYIKQGYTGQYPFFQKEHLKYLVEEHPFTILEADDYNFRIHEIQLDSSYIDIFQE